MRLLGIVILALLIFGGILLLSRLWNNPFILHSVVFRASYYL